MASTQKLFYERPDLFAAEARLLSVEGPVDAPVLVLDRTIFYPEGGGQSCDLGAIGPFAGGDATEVVSVTEEVSPAGEILVLHAMAGPCAALPGDLVRLTVDHDRRLDYSQQHTAEHLIGSVALRLLGAHVVSVRFGSERSTIDFDLSSIPDEDIAAIEDEVERVVADDYPVRTHVCPPEDIASFPLRRRPPAGAGVLRVVEIDGIDFSPCCGLHLASTGALRLVRVLGIEKYKGMTRLCFVAGSRAAADHRSVSRIAREAARNLGTSVPELPEAASREAERRKELEYAVLSLERERAAREAAEAAAAGPPGLVSRRFADRGAGSLMETAKALAAAGMTALLASLPDLTVQALSPAADARLGERLKGPLAAAGGKGGGGPASFRAVFRDRESLSSFMDAAERELGAHAARGPLDRSAT
jgi:alanyl-tRNA synthetase